MIQLIKAATLGVNKDDRIIAQQKIVQLRLENTEAFFIETSSILQNDKIPSDIRQASGTLIDMSVLLETQNGFLWDKLSPASKQNVKDAILSVLIDHDRNIRRAAANIVAAICCIEIPRNEWDGIIQKISANISNDDLLIKQVSILTLGFICQRLISKKEFRFTEKLQQLILTGILLGLKQNQKSIVETALKALRDGICSMPDILNNAQYRDYLVNQTVAILSKQQYKNYALQILNEFARTCYSHLHHYISGFITLFQPLIRQANDQQNCIQAMQFWQSVAQEYNFRNIDDSSTPRFITGQVGQKIVSLLLQNLCVVQQNDDNQQNGIADSAAKCLQTIFDAGSQQFETLVLNFTSNTIKHQSWKYRQASIRAFAAYLLGANQKRKQQLVDTSLLELVALLNDKSKAVQYSAIKSINIITEECALSFLHHPNFLDILKLIVGKLTISSNFLSHTCKIIDNLCEMCSQSQQLYFHNVAQDLIQLLFDTCLTNDSTLHVINCCVCTIMNLITAAQNPAVSKKQIQFVMNHFGDIAKLQTQKRQILYSSFFTLLQVSLISLRKTDDLPMQTLSQIYKLVIGHFTHIKKVDSDGIYVIGTLSHYFRDEPRLIDDFWKYIEYSITQYNESHTLKAGLSCICDFAANYGLILGDRIPKLMEYLHLALQNSEVSRQSKLDLIMCIGEMYLNCGQVCIKYLEQTMNILLIACQASFQIFNSDKKYAENLRQSIIDTLTCMLHGLNSDQDKPSCKQFLGNIDKLFEFINFSTDKNVQPKISYLKACVLWMADASKFYRDSVKNYVRQKWVFQRLQQLQKINKNRQLDGVIKYAKENF